ncbi:endo alpha-1,4 polygalactosaminidase [Alcanivorax sp.]|uniref:bifunctional glycoside hydrolase 114/ polysaccharide deacetylase family protein n=1 Tax=Alcanivorax sp. TaxID=1872427 RepID=UPI000C5C455E|nr:endo alpha-1,4 polygalactosaminidase [Alcanivorax sp.]MBQ23785.1 hypothetical protein [Alcanivorax sp.]
MIAVAASAAESGADSKTAAFYYGPDIPWPSLAAYDFPVVEPDQADSVPQAYQDDNFYAYVSLGEVLAQRHYFAGLDKAWLLGENPDWGSFILDQSSPALRRYFIDAVIEPLWAQGYRGFFLDTLDSYQLVAKDEAERERQRQGLATLINAIAERHPQAGFIFNRGFELMPLVQARVDAVAAESLYQRWLPDKDQFTAVPEEDRAWLLGQFEQVRERYGVSTIAIDYAPPASRDQARKIASDIAQHNVIPWVTNPALDMMGVGELEILPREVLLVYGGSEERTWELTDAVRYGLMPLQFQGLVPDIRAVDAPMPAGTLAGRYAGIVIWLEDSEVASDGFEDWLAQQKEAGVPILMLGYPAIDPQGPHARDFGFESRNTPASPPQIISQHPDMGFEIPLPKLLELSAPVDNDNATPWLKLRSENQTFTPAATTPWGGYAFQPFLIRSILPGVQGDGMDRWVLNPLSFTREALQLPEMPIPDVTTENGRRLLFAHMDGDGFPSLAEVEGYRGQADALVLLDEILEKFDIPTTISVIEGEVSSEGLYPKMAPELQRIARAMFALPHVEAATHTYSHPFFWYDAQANPGELYGPEGQLRLPLPDYRMDPVREVVGSANYIERELLPPGKKTRMVLWSGDTIPTPEALKAAREGGLLNMNGSDTTITNSQPTWTLVKGIGIPKGDEYQVYAPNQNENIYTNNWTGPFYGFERVIETFKLTETPYRFKPVDIYYHTYIASKNASLESLRRVYQWASEQPYFPLFASDYSRKVLDFNDMVIGRRGDEWWIQGNGQLRTLRLPDGLAFPALAQSSGVAGYREDKPRRYVHLSGANAYWRGQASSDKDSRVPYLQQANGRLTAFSRDGRNLRFSLEALTSLAFSLGNAGGCTLSHQGKTLKPAGREGRLYHYRSAARELNELRLQCPH